MAIPSQFISRNKSSHSRQKSEENGRKLWYKDKTKYSSTSLEKFIAKLFPPKLVEIQAEKRFSTWRSAFKLFFGDGYRSGYIEGIDSGRWISSARAFALNSSASVTPFRRTQILNPDNGPVFQLLSAFSGAKQARFFEACLNCGRSRKNTLE